MIQQLHTRGFWDPLRFRAPFVLNVIFLAFFDVTFVQSDGVCEEHFEAVQFGAHGVEICAHGNPSAL